MIEPCPVCGTSVRVVSGREGTSHYEPIWQGVPDRHTLLAQLREWASALDLYADTHDGSPEMVRAVAVEMRLATREA